MSDLMKLAQILRNQVPVDPERQDWDKADFVIKPATERDGFVLTIDSSQVGFVFDADGRFVGIFNWKE